MSEKSSCAPFIKAKWIWAKGEVKKNDFCIFRKVLVLATKPKKLTLRIAADTHYFLNINNKFIVFEGGINHPANDKNGYYDEIDVSRLIKKGANAIVVICHYFGDTGNDNIDKGRAGFIAELFNDNEVILVTDNQFSVYRNESCKDVESTTNVNFAGYSHRYDATVERPLTGVYHPSYSSNIFVDAEEICVYGEEPFGELAKRPIPGYVFNQKIKFLKKEKNEKNSFTDLYRIKLPRAMYLYPAMDLNALGTEKIVIYTDRTKTYGDFGDKTIYVAPHIEYICKAQKQFYESMVCLYGETLYFEVPKTVKLSKLGYRFKEYDAEAIGNFSCDDQIISSLAVKCINTLKVCITDRIINNPERDRATALDAANITVRALLRTFDSGIYPIVRKTIQDILDAVSNDVIYGNVPSVMPIEIPSLGLLTISEHGMFAAYSDYFSDMDESFADAAICYLTKWKMANGLVETRGGLMDNLYNIDGPVLENCLYYSALKFTKRIALKTGRTDYLTFLESRINDIDANFNAAFFNGMGYSSHRNFNDDRANAFAVLTGLCDESRYETLSELLVSTQNASPYLEGFVLEALSVMDKAGYATNRMSSRYAVLAKKDSTTLSEDFCLNGAQTSGRSVMPLTVLLDCLGGVKVSDGGSKITITPDLGGLNYLSFCYATPKGNIKGEYKLNKDGNREYIIHNDSKTEATVQLKAVGNNVAKTCKIGKGKFKYSLD